MAQRYFIVNHKYEDENIDLEKEASFFIEINMYQYIMSMDVHGIPIQK